MRADRSALGSRSLHQSRGGQRVGWAGRCGGSNAPTVLYDIFRTTQLTGGPSLTNSSGWVWLGRGLSCNAYGFDGEPKAGAIYVLGNATLDPDGDGMSTSYELLVSHSDPNV